MVIPLALFAQNGQVKVGIQSRHRDVEAVHFLGSAVGVGDRIGGGLQPVGRVGFGFGGLAQIQVDDIFGNQTDVEGHLAILHGQGAFAIAGFVGVEHGAVGVKLGGVDAVRQSSGLNHRSGRGRSFGGSSTGRRRGSSRRSAAACQQAQRERSGHNTGKNAFHEKYLYIIKNWILL